MSDKEGNKTKHFIGKGHANKVTGSAKMARVGIPALGDSIFDHIKTNSADQMCNTFKAIIIYVGTALGTNMSIELRTHTWYVIPVPVESDVTLALYDQAIANWQVLHDMLVRDLEAEIQDLEVDPLN